MIIGRSIAQPFRRVRRHRAGRRSRGFGRPRPCRRPRLEAATFSLTRGEILGVAGLQGMGQRELFLACFGMADISRAATSPSTAAR